MLDYIFQLLYSATFVLNSRADYLKDLQQLFNYKNYGVSSLAMKQIKYYNASSDWWVTG